MRCPRCDREVVLAAVQNQRNQKWTAVPLDYVPGPDAHGNFIKSVGTHEAFDILGNSLGELPKFFYAQETAIDYSWVTHPPSHFLEPGGHADE